MEANRKIKILFAINDVHVGGAQNMVIEEANAIDADVFEPYLVTLFDQEGPRLTEKLRLPPGRLQAFAFRGLVDIRSWLALYRYLRRERFDVVITNLFNANLIVRIAAVAAGVRLILSWEHNVYADKHRWQIAIDKILAYVTYRILVGAPQVKTFTLAQEHLAPEKIEVVYDAADLAFGDTRRDRDTVLARYHLPRDNVYIVACGHLTEQKGHTHLIEAARLVGAHYGGSRGVTFLIFGRGELQEALAEQIRASGLDGQVRLLGIAPMHDILAMSDIFSLISLWEGFSIALIQAMSAGCPVVASRVSGSVDAIENEVDGLLVPPRDPTAAAAAYVRLIDDVALAHSLSIAAKKKSEQFDIRHQMERIEAIVREGLKLS